MKGKAFIILIFSVFLGVALFALPSPNYPISGIFPFQNGWSGVVSGPYVGYPGRVIFSGSLVEVLSDGTLSGSFWLGNVGWATFSHGMTGEIVSINCPIGIWNTATMVCPITGAAWSQNAGWIVFSGAQIGVGSGAYFNPNTSAIEGWGYSHALGWVPFWTGLNLSGTTLPGSGTTSSGFGGTPINLVSKIAIVGNIAGSRVYSVSNSGYLNQDVGYSYKAINHASILNLIRKNIALMTRNVDLNSYSGEVIGHDFVYRDDSNTAGNPDFTTASGFIIWQPTYSSTRSIIVVGGDIVIRAEDFNSATPNYFDNKTIGLIALKNAAGSGGNIYIKDDVKRIYAYMYAEGSLFSGDKTSTGIVHYVDGGPFNIPQRQLYIRGFVAAKNTIGGAQQNPIACPVLTPDCTTSSGGTSKQYDMDYFRNFNSSISTQRSLPSQRTPNAKLDPAVMIIEYDQSILTDPPPGFREM